MTQTVHELRKFTKNTTLTITVRETKEFKIRRWVFTQLLKMAVYVLGCGLEIVDDGVHEQEDNQAS